MAEDEEGFRYPVLDAAKCLKCGRCLKACPAEELPPHHSNPIEAWGGYVTDESVREASTSGGLFSAIADAWCEPDSIVFGAMSDVLSVRHSWVLHRDGIERFRKSKYIQSEIGDCYLQVRRFLESGKKVLFSGTPCQIAGLSKFLGNDTDQDNLLLVEVVCEGVPSPHYIRKFTDWVGKKHGGVVVDVDYRFKDGRRWDFEVMRTLVSMPDGRKKEIKTDRWFNPFWSIWLQHLISRPSCYECPFATGSRGADITLGDLWGVHLYCPDLYGRNGGSSVVFCNNDKGRNALNLAKPLLFGRCLSVDSAIRYQGPMRKHISSNPSRAECMSDLTAMPFKRFVSSGRTARNFLCF